MKILCVSDQVDPRIYVSNVRERFPDIDLVISAGDLPMEYLGFLASSFNIPILFVFGNHNTQEMYRFRRHQVSPTSHQLSLDHLQHQFGSTHLHRRVVRTKNLLVAGLGGSMRYNQGENQFTDVQMYLEMFRMIPRMLWNRMVHGRCVDILVTHAPPFGVHDQPDRCHTGFKAFHWFIKRFKPRYLLHGHIHLYDLNAPRVSEVGGTRVINVFSHYLLEIKEHQ